MIYENLLEKREATQVKLLKKLMLSDGKGNLPRIAQELNVSKVSLTNYIEDLIDNLSKYNKQIELKTDGNVIELEMDISFSLAQVENDIYLESIKYKIIDYLFHHIEFNTVFLAAELMISESTVFRKIKELNQTLKEFEISIWQGKMIGEEHQIRYFYFQFYWHLKSNKSNVGENRGKYIEMVEKALDLNLSDESQIKVNLWLSITKKRLALQRLKYDGLSRKNQLFYKDPLYLKIKEMTIRLLGNYAVEIEEEECMLQFAFLLSMSILSPDDFYEYSLVRSRFSPTALLDTVVLESLLMYYKPLVFPRKLEKHIYYLLSQIHPRIYFFKGNVEIYDQNNIWQVEESMSAHSIRKITSHLLSLAKKQLKIEVTNEDSLFSTTEIKYLSIIVIIDSWLRRDVTVGISLEMEVLFKEAITKMLMTQLSSMNSVICEPYDSQKKYDLIITNKNLHKWDSPVYVFSELGANYDFQKIKQAIRNIYKEKNSSKLNKSLL